MTKRYENIKDQLKTPLTITATYSRTGVAHNNTRMVCVQDLYVDGKYIADHLWIPIANNPKLSGHETVTFEAVFVKRKRPAKHFMDKPIVDIKVREPVVIVKL